MPGGFRRSVPGAAFAGLGVVVLTACTTGSGANSAKPTTPTIVDSPSAPSASASRAEGEDAAVKEARSVVLSQGYLNGKDAPDEQGLAVAAVRGKAVALTWLTTDGRFCRAAIGGASEIGCDSSPEGPRLSETPQLVRMRAPPGPAGSSTSRPTTRRPSPPRATVYRSPCGSSRPPKAASGLSTAWRSLNAARARSLSPSAAAPKQPPNASRWTVCMPKDPTARRPPNAGPALGSVFKWALARGTGTRW